MKWPYSPRLFTNNLVFLKTTIIGYKILHKFPVYRELDNKDPGSDNKDPGSDNKDRIIEKVLY